MSISFDKALGIHAQSLLLRGQRAAVLAANLANADTPHYKAQDLDFKKALQQASKDRIKLQTTQASHINADQSGQGEVLYRIPNQPAIDGNTVNTHIEQSEFMQNALQYQASLRFLSGSFKGLISAIRGD